MKTYWERHLIQRLTRRRSLQILGGASVGAALLAACGARSKSPDNGDNSSVLSVAVDTTKQAKRGGVFKGGQDADIPHLDPMTQGSSALFVKNRIYQKLVRQRPGHLRPANVGEIDADLAEVWEVSSDGLQITFKLRNASRWDSRPPTNGRAVDSSDVVFMWKRMEAMSPRRSDLANSVNPDAPIISMTAPDPRTVVLKLKEPQAGILTTLTATNAGYFHVVPIEAESTLDLRTEARGSGAWSLAEWSPSTRTVIKRNPDYFDKERPFIDTWEIPIITEYASRLAQLRAGAMYTTAVRGEDLLQMKQDVPALNIYSGDISASPFRSMFGWQSGLKSPFTDERVRQAFSRSLDRETFIDTFYNVSKFTAAGLAVDARWNTAFGAQFDGWWLDPQGKDFGENAKYYAFDLAEAKKLLSAAGFSSGVDAPAHHITTTDYGATFVPQIEVVKGMVSEAGIRLTTDAVGFLTDWRPRYYNAKGNFDGLAFNFPSGDVDPGNFIFSMYNSRGAIFPGFDPDGKSTFAGDKTIDDLTLKMTREFDQGKRWSLAHELQKYEAKKQYYPMFPGGATGFSIAWPVVSNFAVHQGHDSIADSLHLWLDGSKPPLA